MIWKAANKTLDLSTGPKVMGILNVTPDSFSDGGKFNSVQVAIDHALRMEDQGAAIIDIGGESTRPGAEPVDREEEIRRVVPVVKALAERTSVILSIDTTKSEVAEACLNLGAHAINDISGLTFDPKMMDVARNKTCGWMLMHIQGTPKTMQKSPSYTAVAKEVTEFLLGRMQSLLNTGVQEDQIVLDPGIGFGKTQEHNMELLANWKPLRLLGRPICLGVSRKKFLGTLLGRSPEERLAATLGVLAYSYLAGSADIFRVHDVLQARDLLETVHALKSWNPGHC